MEHTPNEQPQNTRDDALILLNDLLNRIARYETIEGDFIEALDELAAVKEERDALVAKLDAIRELVTVAWRYDNEKVNPRVILALLDSEEAD